MGALDQTRSNKVLDAILATTALTASVAPIKTKLMTANGSATSNGTEVAGGSYVAQTLTSSAASGGSAASSAPLTYTGMPAVTVVGVEDWDSAGTPVRQCWGALTASKTTNAGDTLTIAAGSHTLAFP
jgi:hypothetical protein